MVATVGRFVINMTFPDEAGIQAEYRGKEFYVRFELMDKTIGVFHNETGNALTGRARQFALEHFPQYPL